MIGGGGFGWAPGEFTDDTQMAMVLALSLLERGVYDPDDLWDAWRRWAATAVDVGTTTSRSLAHIQWREVPLDGAGDWASNGALMRAFPLVAALAHVGDVLARRVVLHQAALTHPHPASGWGAWLAVAMMRAAVAGRDLFAVLDDELAVIPTDLVAEFRGVLRPDWTPADEDRSNGSVWICLAQAVWAVRHHHGFEAAVTAAVDLGDDTDTVACVTGALAGSLYGIQAIPSRWATYVHGTVPTASGSRRFDLMGLQELAVLLTGGDVSPDQHPEDPKAPVQVAPGLHAADLGGAASVPIDWAVVSLCRTGNVFDRHPVRRQVYLVDQAGDHNPGLRLAVTDAVDAIDAFLAEGRNVVVHCHGGRSRTGLVLKAWKMRTDGIDHKAAHAWLAEPWPWVATWNGDFERFLDHDWLR
jgi:ADP-ribosyl-[dinitrogen reductase] hydrolase